MCQVNRTEGEMRELLSQLARDKHNMQAKVVQLSRVLSDMQLSHSVDTPHTQSQHAGGASSRGQ